MWVTVLSDKDKEEAETVSYIHIKVYLYVNHISLHLCCVHERMNDLFVFENSTPPLRRDFGSRQRQQAGVIAGVHRPIKRREKVLMEPHGHPEETTVVCLSQTDHLTLFQAYWILIHFS